MSATAGRLQTPLMSRNLLRQQNALLRMFPAASFAKYDRSKPHLNVGTIGKLSLTGCKTLHDSAALPAKNTPETGAS